MAKLDLNLDAYRLIAELLHRLRKTVRQELRSQGGDAWEELLPQDLRLFLSQRRQREQGVSWFRTDNADLLDYASFADLAEILAATPSLLAKLDWLPATGREAMLRVRFLELDTVFQRVAYARPVSELELELLTGLGERLRRSLEPAASAAEPAPPREKEKPSAPAQAKTPAPAAATEKQGPALEARQQLQQALEAGDTKAIMRALYGEVVATADLIFKEGRGPLCPVWETVRESSWYTANFSKLSLAPLSHFFDIVEDVKELSGRVSRAEVLEAVRNRGFAETLLQLKELFQPFL
jgi:hypothetical protein